LIESRNVAVRAEGRELNSAQVSDWWAERARDWAVQNPASWLKLTLKKAYYLVNAHEIPNNRDLYINQPWPLQPLMWSTLLISFPWGIVFPLALLGVLNFRRVEGQYPQVRFLTLWLILFGLSLLPFFICARFRMGMVPPMIVMASLPFAVTRRFSKLALGSALVGLILVNTSFFQAHASNPAYELSRQGALLLKSGKNNEAIEVLKRGVEAGGDRAPAWLMLADALYESGDYQQSAAAFEQYVALRPKDFRGRFTLGTAYLLLQEFSEAVSPLEAAVALKPGDISAWTNLGVAYQATGRALEAEKAYQEAIAFSDEAEPAFLRLGELYREQSRNQEAVAVLERGKRGSPESYLLRFLLAEAYAANDSISLALGEIDAALAIDPGNLDALRVREWLLRQKP
jgi:tetratricopeptide (TPR) repeat protein